ncbi:hypothetical protein BBJ29_007332, partial [Phytophthora kernoviae]
AETLALEQGNLRQVEWFMIDTTTLSRQLRIQDNTSRQIRTFLLLLSLVGATLYALHYILILRHVWAFISNSVYRPALVYGGTTATKYTSEAPTRLRLIDLIQCDPSDGALLHPATMALLYLGAVGALSNIFSLGCTAELSSAEGKVVINCVPSIPLSSRSLVFTSLSSSYWIIRISLQTRPLDARLAHAARNDLLQFWLLNFTAVVVIHFICKSGTDLIFHNTELRFDPHLYAMFCSFILTLVISVGSLLVQAVAAAATRGSRQRDSSFLSRLLHPRAWLQVVTRASSDRKFTAQWSSNTLDSVLNHCATPQIARQLDLSRRRRIWGQSQSKLILDSTAGGRDVAVHIQEFVVVHCAAGAHDYLQQVRWSADGGVADIDVPRDPKHVYCAHEGAEKNVDTKRRESL